ncbi:hypothetical protein BKA69DRAFT_1101004 [Paraphysoderma sedebokerense]|nr:hypothetical protein BKA69DRAFT_1101004 [Paraphysoderma sedebokerense]
MAADNKLNQNTGHSGSLSDAATKSRIEAGKKKDQLHEFVQSHYNIDMSSLVSIHNKEKEVAKRLPEDICAKEKAIQMLDNRDKVISEVEDFMKSKLPPDDKLLSVFRFSVAIADRETKQKRLVMKQELENLKQLQTKLKETVIVDDNILLCSICMERKEEFMVAVCGHTCCSGCSTRMVTCYVCKKQANWKRIYLLS